MNKKSISLWGLTVIAIIFSIVFTNNVYAQKRLDVKIKYTYAKNTEEGVKISWTANKKVDGYNVYRKIDNKQWKKIKNVGNVKSYIDKSTEAGESYTYAIEAYKKKTTKEFSDRFELNKYIKGAPDPIEDVKAKFVDFNKIKVTWTPDDYVSGYYLYRSTNKKKWTIIKTITNESKKSFTDTIDEPGKYCYYKVVPYVIIDDVEYIGITNVKSVAARCEKGIDVSYHNGTIDWAKVKKAGIDFAFIRAGYGDASKKSGGVIDTQFARNVKNARKNGIEIGVYLYSTANNVEQAKNEAKFLKKLLKTYGDFEYPIMYDFESEYRKSFRCKKENTLMVQAFYEIMTKAGYTVSVYSDHNMLYKYLNYKKIKKFGCWMAYWTYDTKNYPTDKLDNVMFWQYSDKGRINGIPEDVDLNVRFVSGKSLKKTKSSKK